ncbi:PREDICTED: uncharacterized protein LOC109584782 [Amphimedon queenslandica]|uniref:Uncharacterized protein n=1 Tax=Amphimedon queenslandica TaxID=400682 RepID=A0AAN0JHF0_AMPQE|nr:PREDICTED: uncharacterized protein LOC109584782 [Amphimedon queenslandica]|eukprot:XP_019856202.1 PREDICTED: uncharacterized protein LOC109584782 [Amphimedon queenslandica]
MVKSVIGGNKEKFVVDSSIKHVNSLMVTFRYEERHKVLTRSGKYLNKATKSLALLLIGYMKANEASCPNYVRLLAILRKYAIETSDITEKKNFYHSFKLWTNSKYAELSEEDRKSIMEEDGSICYNTTLSATSGSNSGWDSEVEATPSPYSCAYT